MPASQLAKAFSRLAGSCQLVLICLQGHHWHQICAGKVLQPAYSVYIWFWAPDHIFSCAKLLATSIYCSVDVSQMVSDMWLLPLVDKASQEQILSTNCSINEQRLH